ncbi:HAD family hydrolase [Occallatibacter savannae]|uniref:HAD family hydrolase n=1 Tax=Occallatibacter savannae TaxID=1002691 RepID=UPI000D688843|nr:HAD family hydrolase [Occallatibacter savannae]
MAPKSVPSPVEIRCKGVLFDMDGILISSIGSVERSWTKWAEMRGVDPEFALRVAHGRRAIETAAMLRPDLDSRDELKLIEDIELADGEGLAVLPGVLDLLAALPADRWTVVTSATERLARQRMAQAGLPVPARLITADDVEQGKPDPAPYVAGAALLGIPPEECIVFEDAESGTLAGRAAGCTVIATTFSHEVESLAAAHYLIEDVTGVRVRTLAGEQGMELVFTPLASDQ